MNNILTRTDYTIDGNAVVITLNKVATAFLIDGDTVKKVILNPKGDMVEHFHKLGDIAFNIEARVLNQLRQNGEI